MYNYDDKLLYLSCSNHQVHLLKNVCSYITNQLPVIITLEKYGIFLPLLMIMTIISQSIALSDALKELRKESPPHHQYTLKMSKSLATLKSRCGQRMLERANLGPDHDTSNQDWFVGIPIAHQCRPKSAPGMINHSGERGSQRRRREATADNNKKTSATTRNDASISSPLPSQPTTNCSSSSNWEPLSLTALGDSASVCNRITSGHGSFRNGRVKLWNQKYSHF